MHIVTRITMHVLVVLLCVSLETSPPPRGLRKIVYLHSHARNTGKGAREGGKRRQPTKNRLSL